MWRDVQGPVFFGVAIYENQGFLNPGFRNFKTEFRAPNCPSAESKFPKKVAKFETKFPKFSPKFAPKFAPKCFVLSWQVEESSPKISPDVSHRKFQVSNRIPNQISPKISKTHFCRLGSPKNLESSQPSKHASPYPQPIPDHTQVA